jgi:hypothetical protein
MAFGETSTSSHGVIRGKGRFGLSDKAFERTVANARARGKKRECFYGPMRKYLDHLWRKGIRTQAATDIFVYNDAIFLFAGTILVTAWPVPRGLSDGKEQRVSRYQEAETVYAAFNLGGTQG